MKKFNFTTESGHDVILETEISEEYYFGLYITKKFPRKPTHFSGGSMSNIQRMEKYMISEV